MNPGSGKMTKAQKRGQSPDIVMKFGGTDLRAFSPFVKCLEQPSEKNVLCVCLVIQPCLTLGNPVDYSPPGSSVHGIFHARIPKWVAVSYSRGSS